MEENKDTEPEQPEENTPAQNKIQVTGEATAVSEGTILPVTEADITSEQLSTINSQFSTEKEMEVHHHTQSSTNLGHGKKFKHYLFEFFMLFLAVFAGFLAENQREHILEHQREKVLMKSMLKDLQTDTTIFSGTMRGISIINVHIDTLITFLSYNIDLNKKATEIYQQEVWANLYYKLIYTDRTIEQLKNSGNFRLIRNNLISDAIIQYDGYVRNFVLAMQDEAILNYYKKVDDIRDGIFKSSVFGNWMKTYNDNKNIIQLPPAPYFLSTDRKQVDIYINMLGKYSVANYWFLQNVQTSVKMAVRLDSLIKKEYHLK